MWTESIEKSLKTIQNNAKTLHEKYLNDYNRTKKMLMVINTPLVLLSALNAYAIFEMDSFSKTIQISSSVTSLIVAAVFGGEMCMGVLYSLENSFNTSKDYEYIKNNINNILLLDKIERKVDVNKFFEDNFKKYSELVSHDKYINKFGGNLNLIKNDFTDNLEDIQEFLEDHWNILNRPNFRRIKKKNKLVIQAMKTLGETVTSTVDPIIEEADNKIKSTIQLSKAFWFCGSSNEDTSNNENEIIEEDHNSNTNISQENEKKDIELGQIYPAVQKYINEPVKKNNKFNMNFQNLK